MRYRRRRDRILSDDCVAIAQPLCSFAPVGGNVIDIANTKQPNLFINIFNYSQSEERLNCLKFRTKIILQRLFDV